MPSAPEGTEGRSVGESAAVPGVRVALIRESCSAAVDLIAEDLDVEAVLRVVPVGPRRVVVETPPSVDSLVGIGQLSFPTSLVTVSKPTSLAHLQLAECHSRSCHADGSTHTDHNCDQGDHHFSLNALHFDPNVSCQRISLTKQEYTLVYLRSTEIYFITIMSPLLTKR